MINKFNVWCIIVNEKYLGNIFLMDFFYNCVYKYMCDFFSRKCFGYIDYCSYVGGKVVNMMVGCSSGCVWLLKDDCVL